MNPLLCCRNFFLIIFFTITVATQFKFPEYDYMPSTKNENAFKEYEMACEQSQKCEVEDGIARINCVRECLSPSCYKEIYSFDELEEGEVDVRLTSFKGCFSQRIGRTRN